MFRPHEEEATMARFAAVGWLEDEAGNQSEAQTRYGEKRCPGCGQHMPASHRYARCAACREAGANLRICAAADCDNGVRNGYFCHKCKRAAGENRDSFLMLMANADLDRHWRRHVRTGHERQCKWAWR